MRERLNHFCNRQNTTLIKKSLYKIKIIILPHFCHFHILQKKSNNYNIITIIKNIQLEAIINKFQYAYYQQDTIFFLKVDLIIYLNHFQL